MVFEKSHEGVRRLRLPFGFAVGFIFPMVNLLADAESPGWFFWSRYMWFKRYETPRSMAWQLRVLWFYFGRERLHRKRDRVWW